MIGHAFLVDECIRTLHDADGQHLVTLHHCTCGGVFG